MKKQFLSFFMLAYASSVFSNVVMKEKFVKCQ